MRSGAPAAHDVSTSVILVTNPLTKSQVVTAKRQNTCTKNNLMFRLLLSSTSVKEEGLPLFEPCLTFGTSSSVRWISELAEEPN